MNLKLEWLQLKCNVTSIECNVTSIEHMQQNTRRKRVVTPLPILFKTEFAVTTRSRYIKSSDERFSLPKKDYFWLS